MFNFTDSYAMYEGANTGQNYSQELFCEYIENIFLA